jgi:hypothetical protein
MKMNEANYQKNGRIVGYVDSGFICAIDIYQDLNNPKAELKYKTKDGEEVLKLDEHTFKIVGSGTIIEVKPI